MRLVHPFPSVLDGVATAAIALVAGADGPVAFRLGLAMTALQFGIGALNDLADAAADAIAQPAKPLPTRAVSRSEARVVAAGSGIAGLAIAASAGAAVLIVAIAGLLDGIAYDLRLKGTPFAWLAFALGVALLPVFAWLGATGSLPPAFAAVFVLAVLAGAALALANASADLERDVHAGRASIATLLGRKRALAANAALLVAVDGLALGAAIAAGNRGGLTLGGQVLGAAIQWAGLALAAGKRRRLRQLGWEVQSVGVAVMAASWFAALIAAGALPGASA